ncbi:hypothetical protein SteCoe_28338 [Stentor coeruleus]|uniref:Calmodulin n=1 Tax=Stentor coeruleus TaxID=5963 RepID=A0A1R2B8E9_9CILI|nr:hypothetical protein SteCoe_28338 [Stentor coeruleus]
MSRVIKAKLSSAQDCKRLTSNLTETTSVPQLLILLTDYNSWDEVPHDLKEPFLLEFLKLTNTLLASESQFSGSSTFLTKLGVNSRATLFHAVSQIANFIQSVTRIQSFFRGVLQRRRYIKMILELRKQNFKTYEKAESSKIVSFLAESVKIRKLTLEQCFRAADKDSDGRVTFNDFLSFLNGLDMNIPRSYLTRFVLIVDEDCSGVITKDEFYKTLSAFQVNSESQNVLNASFQQEVLIKLTDSCLKRDISPEALFMKIDTDGSERITIAELQRHIDLMKMGFQQKEIAALMGLLDGNKNGEITLTEFKDYMQKGSQALFQIEGVKGTQAGPPAKAQPSIASKIEVNKITLFDMMDYFDDQVTSQDLAKIVKKIAPIMTPAEIENVVGLINKDRLAIIPRYHVEDFCVQNTENNMLSTSQYVKKVEFGFKKNQVNFQSIAKRENIMNIIDPTIVGTILCNYGGLNDSQTRRFLKLFGIRGPISYETFQSLFYPENPAGKFSSALKARDLDLESFFNKADKKHLGQITITDFEITAISELGNLDSKLITSLVLMFPLPRIDKPTFIKVFTPEIFEIKHEPPMIDFDIKPDPKPRIQEPIRRRASFYAFGSDKSAKVFRKILENFDISRPLFMTLERFGVSLEQILDYQAFTQLSLKFGVPEPEADEAFRFLDKSSIGFIYGYMFIFALDLILKPIERIPTQDNSYAIVEAQNVLRKLLGKLNSDKPLYLYFPELSKAIYWENALNNFITVKESARIAEDMPSPCFYYQLIGTLQTYLRIDYLCGEQVLMFYIKKNSVQKQAVEFFTVPPEERLTKMMFVRKFSEYFSKIEGESIYNHVYGTEELRPVYHFYAVFDSVLSSLQAKTVRALSFPTRFNKNDITFTEFFTRFANMFSRPLSSYGMRITDEDTETGFSLKFHEKIGLQKNESINYFRPFKITPSHRIRLYHILYVLDTYKPSGPVLKTFRAFYNNLLHDHIPYGLSFLTYLGFHLDQQIPITALTTAFEFMGNVECKLFTESIDQYKRGFVYGFELAYGIDKIDSEIVFTTNINSLIEILSQNYAGRLSQYQENDYKEMYSLDMFGRLVGDIISKSDYENLWLSLKPSNLNRLPFYAFLAVVIRDTKVQVTEESGFKIMAKSIPENTATIAFFPGFILYELYEEKEVYEKIRQKIRVDDLVLKEFFKLSDTRKILKVFGFEILTTIDIIRAEAKAPKTGQKVLSLPFSSVTTTSKSLQQALKLISSELDYNNFSTYNRYKELETSKALTLTNLIEFFNETPENNIKEFYAAMNVLPTGILFYHILAVIESYRIKVVSREIPNSPIKPRDSKVNIQRAKEKLKAFIMGENEKKRRLDCKEIFGIMDRNNDGTISCDEFMSCLDLLRVDLNASEKIALTREVDINGDGRLVYEEILNYLGDSNVRIEVLGLENSLESFENGSLDQAIFKIKTYIKENPSGVNSLENVFARIDEDKSGGLNDIEFDIALNRLKIGLTANQKKALKGIANQGESGEILYRQFHEKICSYKFVFSPKPSPPRNQSEPPAPKINPINPIKPKVLVSPKPSNVIQNKIEPPQNPSYLEPYQINPDRDYFKRGIPSNSKKTQTTILNSEKAAIKRCEELFTNCPQKFIDPDFGPEIGIKGDICLYWTGTPTSSNFPPAGELQWKRPSEWLENVSFFTDGISSNDVIQGSLGDCWLIGALSVLAQRDELVRGSIDLLKSAEQIEIDNVIGLSKGVYPPIFHTFARKGIYVMRFFANSAWRWVIIDDRLPVFDVEGCEPQYVFGHCKQLNEIWVCLIEKAYAKLYGCYEALNGGLIDDGLVDLTGYTAEKTKIDCKTPVDADNLWVKLIKYKTDKCLMGCSIDSEGIESDVVVDGEMTGLLARHAYAIIDVFEIDDPEAIKKRHRLVRLRNPWGQKEWNGKWSDGSDEFKKHMVKLQIKLKELGSDEDYNPLDGNDGTFLMCFRDWRNLYHNLYACVDFADEWWGKRFASEWTSLNSGGVPKSSSRQEAINWAKNPQFIMEIKVQTEIFIDLSQEDGRFIKGDVYPYEKSTRCACYAILKLLPAEEEIKSFDQSRVVKLSVAKLHRTIELRLELPPGKYVIVPATFNAGETGKFTLSIYMNCEKHQADIYVAREKIKGETIEEEEEINIKTITDEFFNERIEIVRKLTSLK